MIDTPHAILHVKMTLSSKTLTSRTYWVLTVLYISELHEIFRIGSECNFQLIDTNSSGIRNHPVLQDSRVRLQGHSESWWIFSSQKLMKLTVLVQNKFLSILTPISTIMSSKNPRWINESSVSKMAWPLLKMCLELTSPVFLTVGELF